MDIARSGSLFLHLDMPDLVRPGEPVPIGIRVQNVTDRPLDLYLRGRTIVFDLVVRRGSGEIVWRRLEGELIPAILRIETIGPGDVLELNDAWDQRDGQGHLVPVGSYSVRGEIPTEGPEPLSTRARALLIAPP
jgi:hypothetical protein